MSQYFLDGAFEWLSQEEIKNVHVNSVGENNSGGYISEIDFEYPGELHNFNNDYPLAPENLKLVMICYRIIVVILQINME